MLHISNFLKTQFQNLKQENRENGSFVATILVLITIPLSFAVNNIALGIFAVTAIIGLRKSNFHQEKVLFLPIVLYMLMAASYFWSIDPTETFKALSKEIPLLLIPLIFMASKQFSLEQRQKAITYFSYAIVLLAIYYLLRSVIRYAIYHDPRAFFYHGENNDDYGLVPKLLNAIHVSVFAATAFFYFLIKKVKTKFDYFCSFLLLGFILMLTSKNIILIVILLIFIHFFFFSTSAHKMRLRNLIILLFFIGLVASFGTIKERFKVEFQDNSGKSLSTNVIEGTAPGVHYVSIKEAWTNEKFTPNDFFAGTAFRIYQLRIFTEFLAEEAIFLKGFGLNASYPKIEEKAKHYNLYFGQEGKDGYQNMNFHNQYVQNFAELGILGFLLIIALLIINLKNALKSKDFIHFAFACLMISLFLTESFLWRQRGVVFFTMLYCLFNARIQVRDSDS